MAKRLTDTDKWKKAWFRKLSPKMKCVWGYLCDNCDHAGMWSPDFELMSFQVGEEVTDAECRACLGDRVQSIEGGKYFIQPFIDFQYGELTPSNNTHRSVLSLLKKAGVLEPLGSPSGGDQDKDKDISSSSFDEDLKTRAVKFDLEAIYKRYPRKEGKTAGLKKLVREIKTETDFAELSAAVDRYAAKVRSEQIEKKFVKHFSTFAGCWRDYLSTQANTITPLNLEELGL